jgi:putative flippase GtrA
MRAGAPFRFVLVSAAAFGLDAMLAIWLRSEAGWPVWLAAAVSFMTVAVLAYPLHEYWTFSRERGGGSARRLVRTLVASAVALSARTAVIAILETVHEPDLYMAAAYLLAGALASLSLNYAASRAWVFRTA